ncbi:MAG: tRNA (adenosine(37)-N6)-threonylcarbamoyltransferase complex dimerization subunit type 1 TsaB [Chlamydiales bacterium]
MLALFIDTSTETKIFAILTEDGVISRYSYSAMSNTINEPLFTWLVEATEKHECTLSDLTCIVVGYGPGPSFTGIRMGVALANSLAYALSLPVIGLCSLQLYKPIIDSNIFYVISDARGGELYYVQGKVILNTYEFTKPKVMNLHCWQDTIPLKDSQIISMQHGFFEELINKNLSPGIINWEYIIKKIFQKNTYLDPLFFTIPYFKNPR